MAAGHGQVQASADLFADLRNMLNNPEYSDVRFLCEDKVPVHASRLLVIARCPVLKNMLSTNEKEIILPDISSSTLLSILEFLYTGSMLAHAPQSSRKAYEVISASRYFQLRKVEEIVREFLMNSTAEIADDMTRAALRLSVALEFGTLSGTMDAIPVSLVRILNSGDLQPNHLRGLSEKAFRYFLKRTQSTTDPGTLSFNEYLRFRQIILWCATQVCPDEATVVVNASLPDARSAVLLLRDSEKLELFGPREDAVREFAYLKSLLIRKAESTALVDSLLRLVDFRRVHAELLAAVVEPLKIVPSADVMAAFRFQALQKSSRTMKSPQFQWEHGSSYSIAGDGYVLSKTKAEIGFARFSVPISRPYGIFEWDIIIEELCLGFCEIGFHNVDGLRDGKPNFTSSTLAQQPTGWALRMDIEKGTRINQREGDGGWVPFNKSFAYKNARVRVHLDVFEHSCSFSVDGDEYLVAWLNLPHGVYFPAVSLGAGTTGRIRIELVNGFDML